MAVKDTDDKDLELESSTGADLDDASDESQDDTGAAAKSSAATDGTESDETSNIVRDVVDGRDTAAAASSADGKEAGSETGGTAVTKEPDNENFTDVPFHKHPRFQHVIRERNALREDAGRYQNVQKFLDTNGLGSDEAADGLIIMAQAKYDPAGAWTAIKPWVQKLLVAAGEVLPSELQERVTKGELTQDAAFELSRANAKVTSVAAKTSFEQQQRERQTQTEAAGALVKAANDWEADRRKKDPHFNAKFELVQREVLWLQSKDGKPKDAEGVEKQLKAAYESVNKSFKPPVTVRQRPAIRPVVAGQVAGTPNAAPRSTLDIVRANRRQRSA